MKRLGLGVAMTVLAAVTAGAAVADEAVIAGVDVGLAAPVDHFADRTHVGGVLSPFGGYMFNDYVGLMGALQLFGASNKDRQVFDDTDATWAFGAHAGPRLAAPLGTRTEVYATWQGGVFTGLAGNTPISRTSWGYSTGGGLNLRLTDEFLIGAFARYNWLDQRVNGGDVKYVSGGLSLTYNVAAPEAPAPVAQAAAPPPAAKPAKRKIVLRGVHFDFDKATIRSDARPVLNEAIATLKQEGGVAVIVEGHTDSKGTDAYNQNLSERRAIAVRDYLIAGGISPRRITAEGLGESMPVASNNTDDGRAQNRRVELRIRGE